MIKGLFFAFLSFSTFLYAFEPVSYETIISMAKKINKNLTINKNIAIKKSNKKKIEIKTPPPKIILKKKSKKDVLTIKRDKKKKIKLVHLPYLRFDDVVKEIIGSPDDIQGSLCKVRIEGRERIDYCRHVKEWINERNRLLDEFVKNLYKLKMDMKKQNVHYKGRFNCGILYKYYTYEHYNDCHKMFNYMTPKERNTIHNYIKSFLSL